MRARPRRNANSGGTLGVGVLGSAVLDTVGALFWFDVLNRLGSLRNNGTKPEPPRR